MTVRGVVEILPYLVVALVVLAGTAQVLLGGDTYGQIGRGGLSVDDAPPEPATAIAAGEREEEIRQMLHARNARRARQGRPPVDVDAELRRLVRGGAPAGTGGASGDRTADPALEAEVRELVIARNARRARRGEPPLDVESEVARQLRER